jgi:hypothetical protein
MFGHKVSAEGDQQADQYLRTRLLTRRRSVSICTRYADPQVVKRDHYCLDSYLASPARGVADQSDNEPSSAMVQRPSPHLSQTGR